MANKFKNEDIIAGVLVAFTTLPDASWFEVTNREGDILTLLAYPREEGLNYRPTNFYASLVTQVKDKT